MVVLLSCLWFVIVAEEGWGWPIILGFTVAYAGLQILVLMPTIFLFLHFASRPVYFEKRLASLASCMALGAITGLVGGFFVQAIRSIPDYGMHDPGFPTIQGTVLGLFFWIFYVKGLFKVFDADIK